MTTAHPEAAGPPPSWAPGPRPARPGFVRLLPYLVWEAVLLLLVLTAAALVAARSEALGSTGLLYNVAGLGLLATGLAFSLRTGTPNLAVVAFAGLSGASYAALLDAGWTAVPAALAGIGAVLLLGLILGLICGLTSVPAWAVSLAGLAGASGIALAVTGGQAIPIPGGAPDAGTATAWLALFVIVSIGGGLLWQVPVVRDVLGTNRSTGEPVGWDPRRLLGALVGFVGSSVLAALSGLVVVSALRIATPGGVDSSRLTLAVAAVLLGGVSAFGRRGGIAGTLLATVLLVLIGTALTVENAPFWVVGGLLPAVAIVIGVLSGRLLDFLAGPEPATVPADVRYRPA